MADTKNVGPLLVSYGNGDLQALPVEWRARMGFRQEDQQVPLGYVLETDDIDPPDPVSIVIEDRLIQTRTDERKRTSVVLNSPPPNGGQPPPGGGPPDSWVLVSEERVPWGQVATRTRAFVPEGSHLVLTDDMLQAEQKNLGIGLDQVVLTAPLPGPQIVDTKWDEIASLVSTVKRRKLVSQIVDGETIIGGVWSQTSREGETATVASEVITTRTLPSSSLVSTKFDPESVLVTTTKTKKEASTFVDGENIIGNLWTRRYREGETGLVAMEIVESRTLPGPTIISWRIEDDGTLVTISKTKKLTSSIVEGETATTSLWTKTYGEGETALISTEVVETRALPTAIVTTTKFDEDSTIVTITRQRKLATSIVTQEIVTPTLWTKRYRDGESGLVATQVEEVRVLPGATMISTRFDQDSVMVSVAKTKKKADQFTDGEDIVGNLWTKVYRDGETGLVATEIRETRTIGSPTITSYKIDDDGDVITIDKTKKLLNNISEGEIVTATLWRKTSAEGETLLVATEIVESRPLGGSAKTVESSRIDDDGAVVTIKKNKKRLIDITEEETVTPILWTKRYADGVTGLMATEIVETRGLGTAAPTVKSSRLDKDGLIVNIAKTKKKDDTIVAPVEGGGATSWTRTYREQVDGLVATEVVETAVLPGPDVISFELQPDNRVKTITKSRVFWNTVTASESITNNVWTKVYKEGESGKLVTKVIETLNVARNANFVIPSAHVDGDEVVVTTTKSILDETLIAPAATVAGTTITRIEQKEVSKLVSEEIKSQFTFLDKAKYSVEVENPLPPQLRSLAPITEVSNIVAGAAAVPVLGQALGRSQEQVDKLLKRVVAKTIDIPTGGLTYLGEELTTEYGGLLLATEKVIDTVNNPTSTDITAADVTDKNVIRAKKERFGGYYIRDKATHAGAYPILIGGTVDPQTNFIEKFTQQVVDEGTEASSGNGTVTDIKPLDAARSLKTVRSVKADNAAGSIQKFKMAFPGTTDVSIPPQLTAITGIGNAVGGGSGSYSEGGQYTINGQGSGQMRQEATAHSSAHAMLDFTYTIKQIWGQNIPCQHYLFFILGPVVTYGTVLTKLRGADVANDATIAAWPKFQPQAVNLVIVGGKVTSTAKANRWYSDTITADYLGTPTRGGYARSGGNGTSQEVDITVKTVTIPPTIHAALTVTPNALTSTLFGAVATITSPGAQTASTNSQAGSHIYPTTIAVTPGQSTVPSGKFVHRMRVEPWKYNYFKVDCEVVNSADW